MTPGSSFDLQISYLQRQTEKHYPSADNDQQLAIAFADFFTAKTERIREELVLRKSGLVHSPGLAKPTCLSRLNEFDLVTDDDVLKLIRSSTIKACILDPLPATIMRSCYSALVPVFKTIINIGKVPKVSAEYRGGGGTWLNFCWVCAAGLSEPLTHYSLFCDQLQTPSQSPFGKYVIFAIRTQSLSIFMN